MTAKESKDPSRSLPKRGALLLLAGLMVAAAILWGLGLKERAFLGDDYIYLYYAESVPHWYAGNFCHWGPKNHLRPVTWFGVYLEYQLFGFYAPAHHALHLLLHLANGLLFFLILARVFPDRPWAAALAAGLFLLHPIHAEPLGWVAGAVDIIAAFFILAALLAYLHARASDTRLSKIFLIAALLLALYAKETGFALMLLIPLLDLFRGRQNLRSRFKADLKWWLPLWAIGGFYLLSRILILGGLTGPAGSPLRPGAEALSLPALFLPAIPQMFQYLLMPLPQSAGPSQGEWIALAGGLAAWLLLGLLRGRAAFPVLFGLLWMLIALLPALPAFGIGPDLEQSRYLYLPALGFCLAIASPAGARVSPSFGRGFLCLPLCLLLAAESLGARENLKPWQESSRLVAGLFQQVRQFRPQWNPGDTAIFYDLPRFHRGAHVLGDDQTLTAALSLVLFPLSIRQTTTHQAQGLRVPLEARTCGFISPAAEIPPPRWDFARLGRDWFVYQYDPAGLKDRTETLRTRLRERQELLASARALPSLELYTLGAADRLTWHDLVPLSSGGFQITGPQPFLIFHKSEVTALMVDALEIEMQAGGVSRPGPSWAMVYWSPEEAPRFSEARRAGFQVIPDGRLHRYRLDLGDRPRWLEDETVHWFRLDPGFSFPYLLLKQARLIPCSRPAASP